MPSLSSQATAPSSAEIINYFRLFKSTSKTSWLDVAHPKQDGELPGRLSSLTAAQRIALVAVRGPLHCADGWSYLSQAVRALFAGHAHTCRHLAYYAELRAALSILASQGICIGKMFHFYVDVNGAAPTWKGLGTHEEVWDALTHWVSLPNSFGEMMNALRIGGVRLQDALTTFFPALPAPQLGTALIKSWGYDLGYGPTDRKTRNISSYGVNDLTPLPFSVSNGVELTRAMWEAIAPIGNSLETHLLKKLLREQITASADRNVSHYRPQYDGLDDRLKRHFSWKFLKEPLTRAPHPVFVMAANQAKPALPESVLSRALLLLRLATSMNNNNFGQAGLQTLDDLEFWWPQYGSERGFYDSDVPPDDLSDLWSDVEIALDDLKNVTSATSFDLARLAIPSFGRVCEADRAVLWALIR